jgi:hypothetical protein
MGFTIEHGCPQCGAALEMDESDHILSCPYCDVKSFLYSQDYFRYVLPDNAPKKELIYAPYLRFKGVVYFCSNTTLDYRIVDITRLGIELKSIPTSLGLRPQAMKLRFVKPELNGSFLKFSLKATDILTSAAKLSSGPSEQPILHRAFIGETMSIIYLPMYIEGNMLFDGILNRPMVKLPRGREDLEPLLAKTSGWGPRFISTLCPQCGWKLDGERDSVVLLCKNCHTAWEIKEGRLDRVNLSIVKGRDARILYIPFWRISASVKGVDIDSFSDFVRVTNQPMIISNERGSKDMNFFSPAFKLRPNFFLNLARQFTILQRDFTGEETFEEKEMYAVTLPKSEAVQALKIILAGSAVNVKNIFPNLPKINFVIKELTLVYLPFEQGPNDMIQEDTGICINRPSLEFGRRM